MYRVLIYFICAFRLFGCTHTTTKNQTQIYIFSSNLGTDITKRKIIKAIQYKHSGFFFHASFVKKIITATLMFRSGEIFVKKNIRSIYQNI